MLYSSPSAAPREVVRVSPWLVTVMSTSVTAFFLVVVRVALRARHLAVRTGIPALVGRSGIALPELSPCGTVRVGSEVWTAESDGERIRKGEPVEVVGASGVTLRVTRSPAEVG